MSWPLCGDNDVFTATIEYRLLLPVFQHLDLGGNKLQFFLDLGEEGFGCTGFFFIGQREVDLHPLQFVAKAALSFLLSRPNPVLFRQLLFELAQGDFNFSLIEQIRLKRQFLTTGTEFLYRSQAQVFFEQVNAFSLFKDDVIFIAEVFLVSLEEFVFFFKDLVF